MKASKKWITARNIGVEGPLFFAALINIDVLDSNVAANASISLPSVVGRGVSVSAVSKAVADTVVLCIRESSAQHMVHRWESDFSLFATVIAKK